MTPFLHRPPRRCWPRSAAGCGWTWPARLPGLAAVASSWANEAAESRHRPMRERRSRPCRMVGDCLQHLQVGLERLVARPRVRQPAARLVVAHHRAVRRQRGVEGPHRRVPRCQLEVAEPGRRHQQRGPSAGGRARRTSAGVAQKRICCLGSGSTTASRRRRGAAGRRRHDADRRRATPDID
jgi:hypothetical protein